MYALRTFDHHANTLADLGVLQAAALLHTGELSALELTQACLQAIDARNGGPPSFDGAPDAINAWARLYPEIATGHARAADERLRRDPDRAPLLCGIPLAVKDLYAVAGLPLTASSRVLEGHVASGDAPVWARLRDQGMVLLGHTHTHEFAAGGTTDQVGNPWALERVAGGSSGGNAATLAARMAPAAIGTDTCGSLRIPSACCGTSAIKPSHGLISGDGIIPLAPSLEDPGPMARTIADCSALLAGMAGLGRERAPVRARPGSRPLHGVTIAVTDRTEALGIDATVEACFEDARRSCESLGARVVSLDAPWSHDSDELSTILLSEVWAYHAQYAGRHDRYRPAIAELVDAARDFAGGQRNRGAQRYAGAQQRRIAGAAAWTDWFDTHGVDLILEPTLPIVPYRRGAGYDHGHAGGPGDPMIALTALWNMTGMPVASVPVDWCAGVSLVAPAGHEAPLIQAAIDLQERALGVPATPSPRLGDGTLAES